MELFNPIQLIIIAVIIVLLVAQKVAVDKGKLVEASYSKTQRLSIAISIAAIPFIWGLLTNQYFIIVLGVVMGVICYKRKAWYKFK